MLKHFIDEGDIQGLKEYFYKELVPECKGIVKVNNNLGNLQHVKLIPIKGLISSKYFLAKKLGIVFHIEAVGDINKIDMKIFEFSRYES